MIGDNIVVEITGLRKGAVRVGIVAPDDVTIWRQELWKAGQKKVPKDQLPAGPNEP